MAVLTALALAAVAVASAAPPLLRTRTPWVVGVGSCAIQLLAELLQLEARSRRTPCAARSSTASLHTEARV